ncbi:unnamed protein product [Allacma fusca]|uniref:dolichol kinase n=1 Tax=Allacma fusca TaxID=39272 RepID=A0A8J2M7A6_9HEXA|nr:unnamed protein product [Allacma fusca]
MSYRTASDGFWTILLIPLAILLNDEERVFKSILVIVTFNSVVGYLVCVLVCRSLLFMVKPWKFSLLDILFCSWAAGSLGTFLLSTSLNDFLLLGDWIFRGFIDNTRAKLIVSWLALTAASIAFVIWKNMTAEATDTIDRKYFHFIMVLVCIPGVFLDFRLLYISSVAAVCAFVILEVIRLLRIEICHVPVGDMIENCVKIFRDSKDEGVTILTPVYLLAGCSLPFWLNLVDPRADVTNLTGPSVAAAFAGILSIGVGDTFASVGGLAFGKTKWKGSNKSVEGTLCSLVAQLLVIGALWASDLSSLGMTTVTSLVIAAVINAFVEAKTDQIDNLVLPLLTYDVIIGVEKALLWYYVQQRPI